MKKIIIPALASFAMLFAASCSKSLLEEPQKGVTPIEDFYKTEDHCKQALVAAYDAFVTETAGFTEGSIYCPFHFCFNLCADDLYGAGEFDGDNDFSPAMNEFRYDSGNPVITNTYKDIYIAMLPINQVIEYFQNGIDGKPTDITKQAVAEARVLRAYLHMMLAIGWDCPPLVDHILPGDALPLNCNKDPHAAEVGVTDHNSLLIWCANECIAAANDLTERKDKTDKNGAARVTKGFAYSVAGKAYLFAGKYEEAKKELLKVIESGKYELVPTEKYWENFHIQGDLNEEKIFEGNIENNSSIGDWSGMIQRTTWMEANIWSWRSDHFVADPVTPINSIGGWGGCGVPQEFAEAMLANDGESARFKTCFYKIEDLVYNTKYDTIKTQDGKKYYIPGMTQAEKEACNLIGLDARGLYGQSFYLPYKQLPRTADLASPGTNQRKNNFIYMRYAEVLLMYAEACLQTGNNGEAKTYINKIQSRAGSKTISDNVDMNVLKKEKQFEMWLEGNRWPDMVRWGDFDKAKNAGNAVTHLYDKLSRPIDKDDKVVKDNGRFYIIIANRPNKPQTGFQANKHEHFPYPMDVINNNPNIIQNKGWE